MGGDSTCSALVVRIVVFVTRGGGSSGEIRAAGCVDSGDPSHLIWFKSVRRLKRTGRRFYHSSHFFKCTEVAG